MSERAYLVALHDPHRHGGWRSKDSAQELRELTYSCGLKVAGETVVSLRRLNPGTYIGQGKAIEIMRAVRLQKANVVIFSHDLSGAQQRNLEELLHQKTI